MLQGKRQLGSESGGQGSGHEVMAHPVVVAVHVTDERSQNRITIQALTRANRQGYLLRGYLRSQAKLPQPKPGTYQDRRNYPSRIQEPIRRHKAE
ncbi:hypothetical protein V6N13_099949 [Hibiscus sabdariffa]|uniref:Uncharacterized protein n=1 Tax=Hibiscus sabdariffa TaxID=183260 RepID=A0ABR2NLB6_9ROSI